MTPHTNWRACGRRLTHANALKATAYERTTAYKTRHIHLECRPCSVRSRSHQAEVSNRYKDCCQCVALYLSCRFVHMCAEKRAATAACAGTPGESFRTYEGMLDEFSFSRSGRKAVETSFVHSLTLGTCIMTCAMGSMENFYNESSSGRQATTFTGQQLAHLRDVWLLHSVRLHHINRGLFVVVSAPWATDSSLADAFAAERYAAASRRAHRLSSLACSRRRYAAHQHWQVARGCQFLGSTCLQFVSWSRPSRWQQRSCGGDGWH